MSYLILPLSCGPVRARQFFTITPYHQPLFPLKPQIMWHSSNPPTAFRHQARADSNASMTRLTGNPQ